VYERNWKEAARQLGFELVPVPHTAKTLISLERELDPAHHYVVLVRGHLLAYAGGQIHDWSKGRRHIPKAVYRVEGRRAADTPILDATPTATPAPAPAPKRAASGSDPVAQMLNGRDLDFVYATVCAALAVNESATRSKYAHLNPGQQRMCLGNRLRAAWKKGQVAL
jgi:hypothetical protein